MLLQQLVRTRQQCVGDGWHLSLAGLVPDATLLMERKSCKLAWQLLNGRGALMRCFCKGASMTDFCRRRPFVCTDLHQKLIALTVTLSLARRASSNFAHQPSLFKLLSLLAGPPWADQQASCQKSSLAKYYYSRLSEWLAVMPNFHMRFSEADSKFQVKLV